MKKENKSRFVLLGLLLQTPKSGYEIGEAIKRSTEHFWQESDASIYPMLKKLAKEGKVSATLSSVGKRKKIIYSITPQGRQEFYEWLKRAPEPDGRRYEFLLKFFFCTKEDHALLRSHLERRLREIDAALEEYKKLEEELKAVSSPRQYFWLESLRNGIAHAEVDQAWIEKQLGELCQCLMQ